MIKGYKAFKKGLICNPTEEKPFHFAENTEYEINGKLEMCENGFHFCENPLDTLTYYPLIDDDGNLNDFATVEADDNDVLREGNKTCAKRIKINTKLSFVEFLNACCDAMLASSGNTALASSGNFAKLASSGYNTALASSGNFAALASSGFNTALASSGYNAALASSGDYARLASSGNFAKLASSGNFAKLASSGYNTALASSGDFAKLASSGDYAALASSSEYARLASSGDYAKLASSGDFSLLSALGESCVVCNIGVQGVAKASLESWITLAEWGVDKTGDLVPTCVKTEFVDGERIKANVFYRLKDGRFEEINDSEDN